MYVGLCWGLMGVCWSCVRAVLELCWGCVGV